MFFSIKELSKYLQIKPSTLYAWASKGIIPHYKVHGLLRFKQDEIDAWLAPFHKDRPAAHVPSFKKRGHDDVDSIIASAKREVYNLPHGRPDRIRAGKEGD